MLALLGLIGIASCFFFPPRLSEMKEAVLSNQFSLSLKNILNDLRLFYFLMSKGIAFVLSVVLFCFQSPPPPPIPNPHSCLQGRERVDLLIYFSVLLGKYHLPSTLYSRSAK